jgi:hypothetical protein
MIIGLAGYAGSGKDTVGKILVEQHGFRRVAFADKVKELALKVSPRVWLEGESESLADYLQFWCDNDWDKAKQNEQVREILQRTGQGVRDVLGDDAWIDAALCDIGYDENVVITDVRYKNEVETIAEMGGHLWWISRPGVGPVNDHPSENSIDEFDCDFNVHNVSSLKYLESSVRYRLAVHEVES